MRALNGVVNVTLITSPGIHGRGWRYTSPPARLPVLSAQLSSSRKPASGPGDVFLSVIVVTMLAPFRLVTGGVYSTVASPRYGEISFLGAAGAAGCAGVCASATGAHKNPRAAARATDRWNTFIRN